MSRRNTLVEKRRRKAARIERHERAPRATMREAVCRCCSKRKVVAAAILCGTCCSKFTSTLLRVCGFGKPRLKFTLR